MKKIFTTIVALFAVVLSASASLPTPTLDNALASESCVALDVEDDDEDEWEFWWGAGFDLASNYMWRGFDQSYRGGNKTMLDPSFQPGLSFGYGKFYIELWGNASLLSDYKEFDMFLGFEHEDLLITIYDVFCGVGQDFNKPFFSGENHSLTATIDYTFFDRLRLHWATTFLHPDDFITEGKRAGKRAFSSYFEVAYTQPFGDVLDMEVAAGASPWTGPFWCPTRVGNEFDWDNPAKGFNVTNLSLKLSHEFEMDSVTLPVELNYVYNPLTNYHYALLKAGFNF
ncbi:MAG: hypothetical protein IKY74_01755 [Alistipes sp.]|nr:hypothetical protein [Alistipes sp.]